MPLTILHCYLQYYNATYNTIMLFTILQCYLQYYNATYNTTMLLTILQCYLQYYNATYNTTMLLTILQCYIQYYNATYDTASNCKGMLTLTMLTFIYLLKTSILFLTHTHKKQTNKQTDKQTNKSHYFLSHLHLFTNFILFVTVITKIS